MTRSIANRKAFVVASYMDFAIEPDEHGPRPRGSKVLPEKKCCPGFNFIGGGGEGFYAKPFKNIDDAVLYKMKHDHVRNLRAIDNSDGRFTALIRQTEQFAEAATRAMTQAREAARRLRTSWGVEE